MTHDQGPIVRGELRITTSTVGTWTVLACEGDLDVTTSSELRTAIRGASPEWGVVIDLDHVAFIDSTALGVLIAGQKRLQREGRELRIVVMNPTILRIISITGLDDMFTLCTSVQDASTTHG
jgi:anti-sigma B factor antagonist